MDPFSPSSSRPLDVPTILLSLLTLLLPWALLQRLIGSLFVAFGSGGPRLEELTSPGA